MNTLNVKKGDNVVVNSGENKGKTGKVLSVNVEKKTAIVEGINIVKKSTNENGKAIRSNGKVTNIKINK